MFLYVLWQRCSKFYEIFAKTKNQNQRTQTYTFLPCIHENVSKINVIIYMQSKSEHVFRPTSYLLATLLNVYNVHMLMNVVDRNIIILAGLFWSEMVFCFSTPLTTSRNRYQTKRQRQQPKMIIQHVLKFSFVQFFFQQ